MAAVLSLPMHGFFLLYSTFQKCLMKLMCLFDCLFVNEEQTVGPVSYRPSALVL